MLNEESQYEKILNQYYQKKEIPNPVKSTDETELQRAVLSVADSMGLDYGDGDLRKKANNARQLILKNLSKVTPNPDKPKGTSINTSAVSTESSPDIPLKKWPKYEEFRKKYYDKLVSLGWPRDISEPSFSDNMKEGGTVYPWNKITKSAYPFNKRGKGLVSFRNYTKKIKDYLYTKFENNQEGLKKLLDAVESILDVEAQYLKKKKSSMMGTLLLNVFRGIGGTEADENILKWLSGKANGMTVFEYAKYILEEMFTKMSISDSTSKNLKAILFPLHRQIKDTAGKYYNVGRVETDYSDSMDEFVALFSVSNRTGTEKADTKHSKVYSPFVFILENTVIPMLNGTNYTSKSGRKLNSDIDVEYVQNLIKKLQSAKEGEASKIIGESEPIILNYDSLDEKGKKNGVYRFSFEYYTKGCRISVGYIVEKIK
jgi:hypothetical protein